MNGRNGRQIGLLLCAALVTSGLCAAAPAFAAGTSDGEPSYMDGALSKLGRGIANIATGPLELVRTPELVTQRDGTLAGVTVGVCQGLWRGVLRELAGAFEVVTFFVEVPKDFKPLMSPEFVWQHGNWVE